MDDIRKLARVYVWSGAVSRVLLAVTPLVICASVVLGDASISIQGGV